LKEAAGAADAVIAYGVWMGRFGSYGVFAIAKWDAGVTKR
jgi:hypothetical protein